MKPKIYYYSLDKRDTTAFFRTTAVLPFIYSPDFELIDISDTKVWDWTTLSGASILFLQRPFTRDHVAIMMSAKNMGVKIITDYDDLLSEVDQFNPTYQLYRDHQRTLELCYQYADEIWCSTKTIAYEIKKYNENALVIPNAHNDYFFPVTKKTEFNISTKKVIYRGGSSHQADVNEKADYLINIMNKNTDWIFNFMGDRYTYIEQRTHDNHKIIPGMPLMEYFRFIRQQNANIFIFPLCKTKFNSAKSNISFLEATYTGAAMFANKNLPEFDKDFIFDIDTLHDEIENYNPEKLKKANEKAWKYIKSELLLSKVNGYRKERLQICLDKQD